MRSCIIRRAFCSRGDEASAYICISMIPDIARQRFPVGEKVCLFTKPRPFIAGDPGSIQLIELLGFHAPCLMFPELTQ